MPLGTISMRNSDNGTVERRLVNQLSGSGLNPKLDTRIILNVVSFFNLGFSSCHGGNTYES